MSFDAFMIKGVAFELDRLLSGARVEKVLIPSKDEIFLALHKGSEHMRLQINAGPHAPRIGLTAEAPENPKVPPMLCMLMRKHLTGAKIERVFQRDFERVIEIELSTYDEMGFFTKRRLIAEIMGRYSNAILCEDNYKILGVLRPVDFTTSSKRQLLPQMIYELPPKQNKRDPLGESAQDMVSLLGKEELITEKTLMSAYAGLSPLLAREIMFLAKDVSGNVTALGVAGAFEQLIGKAMRNEYTPTLIAAQDGRMMDFSCFEIKQYGSAVKTAEYPTLGQMTDAFFAESERAEREHQRVYATEKLMKNVEARLIKKLALQQDELDQTEKKTEYKQKADLITANIYRFTKKNEKITVIDYIDDGNGGYTEKEVVLELERGLTASDAAQRLYKKYNKSKNAEREITLQMQKGRAELEYVQTVLDALSRCSGQAELDEIKQELTQSGYLKGEVAESKNQGKKVANKQKLPKAPQKFTTSSGMTVLVGKNNLQNDYLTFKLAAKNDYWFHVKNQPGSHTVLVVNGAEPSEADLTEAATLAAKNSKATDQDRVEVDYTRIKNVKKPSGARPGFVIYDNYKTAIISPNI